MANPDTADIRQYLTAAYSDEDLTILCADYFREVRDNFTTGMTKTRMIELLLDYCLPREVMSSLLAALERDRPDQYRQRFGRTAAEPGPVAVPPACDPRQIFISHAHEEDAIARRLAADLRQRGWRTWIAPDSIRPREKWVEAISRGLEESGVFVVLLSPAAVKSQWVRDETNIAIELQHQGSLHFIPAEIKTCALPPFWRLYQRVRFTAGYEDGLVALASALLETRRQPVGASYVDPMPRLRADLTHADPATRARAARELGRLAVADDATIAALLRLYPADPADAPRHAALEALLALGRAADVGMVTVPVGEFLMGSGSADDDREAESVEKPQHKVYLPAYTLDRTPVTNAEYRRFIQAGGYGNSVYWKEASAVGRWEKGAYIDYGGKPRAQPWLWADPKWNGDQYPVVGVTWYEALAYARWAGKRLPTEAEWEKAASWEPVDKETGKQGDTGRKRRYPWGDAWDAKRCNTIESGLQKTTPVGTYSPAGDSPCGAADMAGNVFEWCSTRSGSRYPYDPDDGREDLGGGDTVGRVLRGGLWATDRKWARGAFRRRGNPWDGNYNRGFRGCCSTFSPAGGSGS